MAFEMTEEEVALLAGYVHDYAGLIFTGPQEMLFRKRIKRRIDANKLQSAREYYHFLRFDARRSDELRELINLVTVNETYFFRETPQMALLRDHLLPLFEKRNEASRTVRIWSAACSNGAEPYSIAILIREAGLFADPSWKVEIYGTDINSETIQAARLGVYGPNAFRGVDDALRRRFFTAREAVWEVDPSIRQMVRFSLLNLHNPSQMKLMRHMDLILCRNALIYFDAEGKRRVSELLYDSLNSRGYLMIGQSESLFKVTNRFELAPMDNVLLYQRPVTVEAFHG